MKLKLTTKSQIAFRLPEQMIVGEMSLIVIPSASIAANPMLQACAIVVKPST
jgi:hypothetical protein